MSIVAWRSKEDEDDEKEDEADEDEGAEGVDEEAEATVGADTFGVSQSQEPSLPLEKKRKKEEEEEEEENCKITSRNKTYEKNV